MTSEIRRLPDAAAMPAFGAYLAGRLQPGDLVLLEGPLGAGKTTTVRHVVEALGGDPFLVCSPTFVLLETYEVRAAPIARVHHADLYRVRGRLGAPVDEIGLGEALEDPAAVTAVEWPEGWPWLELAGGRVLRVELAFAATGREARISWPNG